MRKATRWSGRISGDFNVSFGVGCRCGVPWAFATEEAARARRNKTAIAADRIPFDRVIICGLAFKFSWLDGMCYRLSAGESLTPSGHAVKRRSQAGFMRWHESGLRKHQ